MMQEAQEHIKKSFNDYWKWLTLRWHIELEQEKKKKKGLF